ncbi:COG3650 family protein [Salipiger mucosus]|uniref:SH3b domain-containing protein n=1 Tax=Salipiger mucosus DSM 16094 TaxID=1123237 RepID=S9RWE0_9RHOB|nr:SH3 domain-containing protein [Salipiger mucosus]EPX82345.1 hypothetical protein Salmuc_04070 [Salipiger mucosus DSM 16094]
MIRTTMAMMLAAGTAAAQDYPALHAVTGVAPDDVLNLRAGPDAGAEIRGTLAPDATGVEVTAANDDGTWGRVNTGEGHAWASLSYLAPQEGGALPEVSSVTCFGTEPFWNYAVTQSGSATFSGVDEETATLQADAVRRAAGHSAPYVSVAGAPERQAVLVMTPDAQCSDGMSDRLFGLSATLVLTGQVSRALTGCCSIAPR